MRITEIVIKNFKNVENGKITKLEFSKNEPSILGIYGQNGSGKTAIVEACNLLKFLMSGKALSDRYLQDISVGREYSEFCFSFVISLDKVQSPIYADYCFKFSKQQKISQLDGTAGFQVRVFDEFIKISCQSLDGFSNKTKLIDSSNGDSYSPSSLIRDFAKTSKKNTEELKKVKFYAQHSSLSSIFNDMAMNLFAQSSNTVFYKILSVLKTFANNKLFVVTTQEQNLVDYGLLPLNYGVEQELSKIDESKFHDSYLRKLKLPLKSNIQIPVAKLQLLKNAISSLNCVLIKIIPELTVELYESGRFIDANSQEICNIEVLSNRNGIKLPLETESNGIKKLISILQLIVAVYNCADVTVVIDELDAGIFEYLLGELLAIIAESGKGQLFFTSHNLRPLELLDKKYLCFTSINPKHRYVRIKGVKTNNNLRDFYYRDIELGMQHDALYDSTDRAQIAFYLYEVGHPNVK